MPVESATKLRDLNPAWPLDTDLVSAGSAHLRLIKQALGTGYLGFFADQTAFNNYIAAPVVAFQVGHTFYFDGHIWVVIAKADITSAVNIDGVWLTLNATLGALALDQISQLGGLEAFNEIGKYYINSLQLRRPQAKYGLLASGTEFSVTAANNLFPNSTPIPGDVVFQYLDLAPKQTFIKVWNGSAWTNVDLTLYNQVAAFGQFSAHSIVTARADTGVDRATVRETVGQNNIHVFNPDGWGTEGLIEWFGEKSFFVSANGEINYSALTIANGIWYMTDDGFFGRYGEEQTPGTTPSGLTLVAGVGGMDSSYSVSASVIPREPYIQIISINVYATGTFAITTGSGSTFTAGAPLSAAYLSATGAGSGTEFEVRFESPTILPGYMSFLGVTKDDWHALSSNRTFTISMSKAEFDASQINGTVNVTVTVREIAFPGTLVTANVTLNLTIN